MPVVAVQTYLLGILNNLPVPGENVPPLAAYITPRDPDTESSIPKCYIWPADGNEARDPKNAGTLPRNTGPGTPSGSKPVVHEMSLWVVWFLPGGDPQGDILFPGMVDAIMNACRTAYPMPVIVQDPWTGGYSQIANVGERMRYRIDPPHATRNQRTNRYDGLITMPVTEIITA